MPVTLAFDVYGTLIDTAAVTSSLAAHVGDRAAAFSRMWREKQLEYAFRRGLMRRYRNFPVCTRQALEYACQSFDASLSEEDKDALMVSYRSLSAFPDAAQALRALHAAGHRLFAFSNGPAADVRALLVSASLEAFFQDVVSVDEVRSFKPDPEVYAHFLRRAGAEPAMAWLVSGNPFDVTGAIAVGMRAVWVKRAPEALFDPWELRPTLTVEDLRQLPGALPA